jgi:hypothetical protein
MEPKLKSLCCCTSSVRSEEDVKYRGASRTPPCQELTLGKESQCITVPY